MHLPYNIIVLYMHTLKLVAMIIMRCARKRKMTRSRGHLVCDNHNTIVERVIWTIKLLFVSYVIYIF